MFTALELNYMKVLFWVTTKLPMSHFDLSPEGRLQGTRSKFRSASTYLKLIVPIINLCVLFYTVPGILASLVFTHIGILFVDIILTLGVALNVFNLWLFKDEVATLINETLRTNRVLGVKYFGSPIVVRRFRELVFVGSQLQAGMGCLLFLGSLIMTMNWPSSFYYFLRASFGLEPWLALILFLFMKIYIFLELLAGMLIDLVAFSCIMSTLFWTNKVCIEWPTGDSGSGSVGVSDCLHVYRCIVILNRLNEIAMSKLFVPGSKLLLILLFSTNSFLVIRYSAHMDLISFCSTVTFTSVALVLLGLGANISSSLYVKSVPFQENMKKFIKQDMTSDDKTKNVYKLGLKGCPVLRCRVGDFYYMESEAQLTMVQSLVNGLVYALVEQKNSGN